MLLIILNNKEAKADIHGIDVSTLSPEMQCAAAVNGIEHDGILYFTDGTLYCYDQEMADKGKIGV